MTRATTDERDALESMVWQFAYRSTRAGKLILGSGGMSALEQAFEVLGWDDPYEVPDENGVICEWADCRKWASTGIPFRDGPYLRLCGDHYSEVNSYGTRPESVKPFAMAREALRGPDRILPANWREQLEAQS